MEKEEKSRRLVIRRRDILLGTALAGVLTADSFGGGVMGETPKPPPDYSRFLKPLVLDQLLQNENSPGNPTVVFPLPSSGLRNFDHKQNLTEINKSTGLDEVLYQMSLHPDLFNNKKIEDIKMYYPIYKAVANKYSIDWYLIWINHEGETGASQSRKAFNGETYPYFGGWQRNVNTWTNAFVDNAFKGLEFLSSVKTRNKTDAREAAAMAAQVAPNIDQYLSLGSYQAVLNAERIFTGDSTGTGLAFERANLWKEYSQIFGTVLN